MLEYLGLYGVIFFSVIKGTGELDRQQQNNTSSLDTNKILEGCPYLLLDVRDKDAYDQCHIISGRSLCCFFIEFSCY